ncbi:MAG TPA: tRNA (adenosine(37)-N6)-threonylcarbamoyltransferase complex dimerization subunit type 1 TsaB [Candidatus Cybelea sp.]|nr:tRNA (adenosine(37)-N6)-threonylcarbamoyltransferase complex dimerization subunit type 1 TsaB [Candidatus Cybelea sp.]
MKVLALDGALGAFSAAIAVDGRLRGSRSEAGNVALERGLTLVGELLDETRLRPAGLDRIAVGCGPGGFTGLRIAIAYAKSLAQAWVRPLVAIDSFDLLEYGTDFRSVLTVVVGRPGVISARYRNGSAVARASGWTEEALDAVLAPLSGRKLTVVGAPKDVLAALAERGIVVRSVDRKVTPAAAAAALLAASREPAASLHEVRADYGELPAAKIPKR